VETTVFPEMVIAGIQALREAKDSQYSERDTVYAVYLAMTAIMAMQCMTQDVERIH
jgi:hypothetical protein